MELDLGQGPKPRGYYVKSGTYGLFPAPYPQVLLCLRLKLIV